MKRIIAVLLMIVLVISGCGNSSSNPDNKTNVGSSSSKTRSDAVDIDSLVGTYVGLHGSAITLFQDGSAEYYWKEWADVETGDSWKVNGNELVMSSKDLGYDIKADLSGGNTSSLTFTGEKGWIDEMFVKVDSAADRRNVDYYIDLIEKQLNITIDKPQKTSVSSIKENTIYMTEGIVFTIPERYSKDSSMSDGYTSAGSLISFDSTDMDIAIIKNVVSTPNSTYGKAMLDAIKGLFENLGTPKSESSENATVAGLDTIIHCFGYDDYYIEVALIGHKEKEKMISAILACEKEDVYKQEFREMLSTAKISDSGSTKVAPSNNDEVKESKQSQGGVDPDLKAFLDSYEAFVDEYVEFMKKYYENPTDLSLLADYADIMGKYSDFADKLDKYDTGSMSTEDYKYYIEVTTRCTQKMLEAY